MLHQAKRRFLLSNRFLFSPRREGPLAALAGWMIAAALVYAPFAAGSVTPWSIAHLVFWLSAATVIWTLDCLWARRLPEIPWPLLAAGLPALVCGWWMTWNAHGFFRILVLQPPNPTPLPWPGIAPLHPPIAWLPGAEEQTVARLMMQRLDALFGMLLVVTDLSHQRVWRERWLATFIGTGAGIALFGLVQQLHGITFVAERMSQKEGDCFATFNYHANAGAYLNLVLPILLTLTLARLLTPGNRFEWIGPLALLIAVLAAVLCNTSRGAQVISVFLTLGLGLWAVLRFLPRHALLYRYRKVTLPGALILALLGAGVIALHFSKNAEKWREMSEDPGRDVTRLLVWQVAVPMAKSAGAWGHGPGMFKMLLPQSRLLTDDFRNRWIVQTYIPNARISMWSMAHNDYLQTLVEFGWVGLTLGSVVLFGGIVCGIRRLRRYPPGSRNPDLCVSIGAVAALLGVAIHAAFDFPLQILSIQMTVALLLGLCWGACEVRKRPAQEVESGSEPGYVPAKLESDGDSTDNESP